MPPPVRRLTWITVACLTCLASLAAAAAGQDPPRDPLAPNGSAPRFTAVFTDRDRELIAELINSPDWTFRAFALLRLERFSDEDAEALIRARLKDDSPAVRCFALREAYQREFKLNAEDFAAEEDPLVIRALMRLGIKLPDDRIVAPVMKYIKSGDIEMQLLGIEIAAASDNEQLRKAGVNRLARIIRKMDDRMAPVISARLGRILNLAIVPRTAEQWHRWLADQPRKYDFPEPTRFTTSIRHAPPSSIAALDTMAFSRLRDYLDTLRQRDLEIAFVMDTTASMRPMLDEARAGADSLLTFLADISGSMRAAYVAYRDHDNPPVWTGQPLTTDIPAIRRFLFGLQTQGGADLPEAVFEGLEACSKMKWNRDAERQLILIGDAPPHERDLLKLRQLLEQFAEVGFVVHAVHVPMEMPAEFRTSLSPGQLSERERFYADYNESTAETFTEIALYGQGVMTPLKRAEDLVPSVMHLTIQETWWPVFDEFYELYLMLCR